MSKSSYLVLGADGLLGRAFRRAVPGGDVLVRGVDNYSRRGHRADYGLVWTNSRMDILEDSEEITELAAERMDALLNFAADVGGVGYNKANGAEIFEANAQLQARAVTIAKDAGIPVLVQVSSVCVYTPCEDPHVEWENQGEVSGSNAGYAMAKRSGEVLALNSGIDRVIIVRPTNMIGLDDHYDQKAHVIPALIRRVFVPGPELAVYSAPGVIRQFLWADTAAEMILFLLHHGLTHTPYNLPPSVVSENGGYDITMSELANTVCRVAKEKHGIDKRPVYYPSEGRDPEPIRRISGKRFYKSVEGSDSDITPSDFEDTPLSKAISDMMDSIE